MRFPSIYIHAGVAIGVAMLSVAARADGPGLSWGGRVTDGQGKPLEGPVDLEVRFFPVSVGGAALGQGAIPFHGIALKDGVFSVTLPLSLDELHAVFSGVDAPVFIEVTDATHQKTYPRQQLSALPYALKVPVDDKTLAFGSDGKLRVNADALDLASAKTAAVNLASVGGASPHAISLRAPAGLAGDVTYTLPAMPQAGGFLTTDAAGKLAWGNQLAAGRGANADITSLTGLTTALSLAQGGTGATTQTGAANAVLPAQGSQSGKILTTDGANASWASPPVPFALAAHDGSPAQAVYVDDAGNVGIGTTTPGFPLDVNGYARMRGMTNGGNMQVVIVSGVLPYGPQPQGATLVQIGALTGQTEFRDVLTAAAGTSPFFSETEITAPRLAANNTGVNTTDAYTTHITGAPVQGSNETITNSVALGIDALAVGSVGSSYGLLVNAQTGGTNNYAASFVGGNVGIGTATPSYALDIADTAGATGWRVKSSTSNMLPIIDAVGTAAISYYRSGGAKWQVGAGAFGGNNNFVFGDSTTGNKAVTFESGMPANTLYLASSGNVGIGTPSPGARLDVNGHVANSGTAASLGACGGSGASIAGNDTRGVVTVGAASTTSCVVTFATLYATAPICTVTWNDGGAATSGLSVRVSATTAALTVKFSTDGTGAMFNYLCMQ